jgi:mannitol/fructose-specific phosphotransferase system IIA component (Ntr-type)
MTTTKSIVVSELLSPATINLNLKSADADSVLEELVNQIPQLRGQPDRQQTLLKALREREQLHSTAIGDGVALPHARNALVGLVDECIIVFGRHAQGISFGAVDHMPARLFFLLIAPTVTQHLAVLARVSRLLRDGKLRQDLTTVKTPEQAIAVIGALEQKMQVRTAPAMGVRA